MTKCLVVGYSVVIMLMNLGCGGGNQLAAGIIYDATIQVTVAKDADAGTRANRELTDAEHMLAQAETALKAGESSQAYRLGMGAYLKARMAKALAIVGRTEEQATAVTKELESNMQAVDAARRQFEVAEDELEKLRATSP